MIGQPVELRARGRRAEHRADAVRDGGGAGDGAAGAPLDERTAVIREKDDEVGLEHALQHHALQRPVAQPLVADRVFRPLRGIERDDVAEHGDLPRAAGRGTRHDAAGEENHGGPEPGGMTAQKELLPHRAGEAVAHRPLRLQQAHALAFHLLADLPRREQIDHRRLARRQAREQVEQIGLASALARRECVDQHHAHAKGASIRMAQSSGCVSRLPER